MMKKSWKMEANKNRKLDIATYIMMGMKWWHNITVLTSLSAETTFIASLVGIALAHANFVK